MNLKVISYPRCDGCFRVGLPIVQAKIACEQTFFVHMDILKAFVISPRNFDSPKLGY
jgi:hypothetical protein